MMFVFFGVFLLKLLDPLTCSLFLVILIIFFSFGLFFIFPFWVPYLIILLFLSGVLLVLVFFSALSKPYMVSNPLFFYPFFFCFLLISFVQNFSLGFKPYNVFFSVYTTFFFMFLFFFMFSFLFFSNFLIYRLGALRSF